MVKRAKLKPVMGTLTVPKNVDAKINFAFVNNSNQGLQQFNVAKHFFIG